jgi:hypothetical protein
MFIEITRHTVHLKFFEEAAMKNPKRKEFGVGRNNITL